MRIEGSKGTLLVIQLNLFIRSLTIALFRSIFKYKRKTKRWLE